MQNNAEFYKKYYSDEAWDKITGVRAFELLFQGDRHYKWRIHERILSQGEEP